MVMVPFWNGGLSEGNTNKRELENGYQRSSTASTRNYKPRKISAVRHFPSNCGPNAQAINLEPEQNSGSSAADSTSVAVEPNCNGTDIEVENQLNSIVICPVTLDANRDGTSANLKFPEDVVMQLGFPVALEMKADSVKTKHATATQLCEVVKSPVGTENDEASIPRKLKDQENTVVSHCKSIVGVPGDDNVKTETKVETQSHGPIGAECIQTAIQVETQSDGPVGSPIGLMQDELLDNLVGKAISMAMNGMDDEVKDVQPMDIEFPKDLDRSTVELLTEVNEKALAMVNEIDSGALLPLVKSSEEDVKPSNENGKVVGSEIALKEDGDIGRPKDKFVRRRVSATRDFPKYCGRNAPPLSDAERIRITSEIDSLVRSDSRNGFVKNDVLEIPKDCLGTGESANVSPDRVEKAALQNRSKGDTGHGSHIEVVTFHGEGIKENVADNEIRKMMSQPTTYDVVICRDFEQGERSLHREIVSSGPAKTVERNSSCNAFPLGHEDNLLIVNAIMAAPNCPWRQGKLVSCSVGGKTGVKVKKCTASRREKAKAVARKSVAISDSSEGSSMMKGHVPVGKDAHKTLDLAVSAQFGEPPEDSFPVDTCEFGILAIGPSSSQGDARCGVKETLRLFHGTCRKLLQEVEAKSRPEIKRIDLDAAKIIKESGKAVNAGMKYLGAVPGVEVGDEFQYRVELHLIGIHGPYQGGIGWMKHKGKDVAISIVASGAYADDMDNADSLTYSGQGGNMTGKDKQPEDQKLERGNLALWNSISEKTPVRVVRGSKETKASDSSDPRAKTVMRYVYDGLYTVEKYHMETGKHGKLVFMFELKRIPGQPELAWKEVKKSKESKVRPGVCINDITGGKEGLPICAVNTIDDEKPPAFNYIREMMYPNWLRLVPPQGCDCIGRCIGSRKCSCASKNGEIPYNRNGAIVEIKPLVYECGPSCKCPPSCYNRVSQNGIKIPLEIFKTEKRGWGVRSLTFIPAGSFICEYVGELLDDREAEQRTGNDEYLFDIGHNCDDSLLNPDRQVNLIKYMEEGGGYTIDAAKYGNVGRFINHSCSPNLYAQNVLYDYDDERMPHIMLFAADNIPPLQELAYDYNYAVDQVHDSLGNIKMKSCFCGSTQCNGRMY